MVSLNRARWVDRKLGQPICRVLSLFRSRRHRSIPNPVKKVLVIKMWGIGSIVLASPVFRNIRRNHPEALLYFLTLRHNAGLYEESEFLDGVRYFDLSSWGKAWVSFVRTIRWMRRERFDVVLDLEFASRLTAIFCFLSRSRLSVGYAPAGSGKDLFHITVPYHESTHITQVFLRSLDALGMDSMDERLVPLPINQMERQRVDRFLEANRIGRFLALNPNTSDLAPERMWPLENFAELAKMVRAYDRDLALVIIGGPDDRKRVGKLMANLDSTAGFFSAAGVFSLRETTCLLGRAACFVTNDSGPLHLGVLAEVPTIGLFGPETPRLYGPLGPRHRALHSGERCSPCISIYNDKVLHCDKNAICMKRIPVRDGVFKEVVRVLEAAQGAVDPQVALPTDDPMVPAQGIGSSAFT